MNWEVEAGREYGTRHSALQKSRNGSLFRSPATRFSIRQVVIHASVTGTYRTDATPTGDGIP